MFFSRKVSLVRKRPSNKRSSNGSALCRRLKIEPLENRCLLSVTLGSPSAAAWVYGQTESASAVVIDGVTNAPPPLHTEVDLVNAGAATAAPSPILAKGFTSDVSGDVTFDLSALNVGNYNLQAEFTDSAGNLEASNTQPVAVSRSATTTTLASSAEQEFRAVRPAGGLQGDGGNRQSGVGNPRRLGHIRGRLDGHADGAGQGPSRIQFEHRDRRHRRGHVRQLQPAGRLALHCRVLPREPRFHAQRQLRLARHGGRRQCGHHDFRVGRAEPGGVWRRR